MKKALIFITLVTVIWSACSKSDPPEGGFKDPVFSVGFDNIPLGIDTVLTAGVNGTYLFTRVELGLDSVLVMSGAFSDASCPTGDCPGSVKFVFRGNWFANFIYPGEIFGADQSWEYKSPLSDTFALHTVAIQWVTPEGKIFRSDILPQPQDTMGSLSHFKILHSESWEKNERGETTWKMDVDFSCLLFDNQMQDRKIMGSGTIAVGYQ